MASHTTIETIEKGLMNKIGAGQVTIYFSKQEHMKRSNQLLSLIRFFERNSRLLLRHAD